MATRTASVVTQANGVVIVTWTGLLNGDNGDAATIPWMSEKCFHVYGTWGAGGALSLKGSNKSPLDTVNDVILRDPASAALTFNAANGLKQVLENPLIMYPHATAGDGST